MADDSLSEDDVYRRGRYGIGRRGYRPVVTLPERIALTLARIKNVAEAVGIILFLISATLFFLDAIGSLVPRLIGALVIGLRAVVIGINHMVVAKTVIREVPKRQRQVSGDQQVVQATPGLSIAAQIEESELGIMLENVQHFNIYASVKVRSENGSVIAEREDITLPGQGGTSEVVIDLSSADLDVSQDDVLDIEIGVANVKRIAEAGEHMTVSDFSIPIDISEGGQMSSPVVEKEVDITIVSE